VIDKVWVRSQGKRLFEKWEWKIRGSPAPKVLNGTSRMSLMERYQSVPRHIVPSVRKRQINSRKAYDRSTKTVEDLLHYLRFMQQHAKDDRKRT
jgi:hypothetical protein